MAFSIFDPQLSWWTEDLYSGPQIIKHTTLPPILPIPDLPRGVSPELRPEYRAENLEIRGNYVEIRLTPGALMATVAPPKLPQLPIEVWDKIIDWLRFERHALVACALTCHAWLTRCRCRLYSQGLEIRSEAGLDAVVKALSSTPDLVGHVSTLTLHGGEHYNLVLTIRALLLLRSKLTYLRFLRIHSLDLTHGHIHRFFQALSLFRYHRYLFSLHLVGYRFSRHSQLVRCASTAGVHHFSLRTVNPAFPTHSPQQSSSLHAAHLDTLRFRDSSRELKLQPRPISIELSVSWTALSDLCERLRFAVSGPRTITVQALQRDEDDLRQITPTLVPAVVEMILRFCSLTQHEVSVLFKLPSGGEVELTRSAGEHPI